VELAATSDVRDWHTKLREVMRCQAVQATYTRHALFEGDALQNVQPVQLVMEDVPQTPVELLNTSDDSSGGVQDPPQLVSRERCFAVIYPTCHKRVD